MSNTTITQIERVQIDARDVAYVGAAFAARHEGREFVILAADHAAVQAAWSFIGGNTPLDLSRLRPAAIISRELFDAKLRPAAPAPGRFLGGQINPLFCLHCGASYKMHMQRDGAALCPDQTDE